MLLIQFARDNVLEMIDEEQSSYYAKVHLYKKYIVLFSGMLLLSSTTFFLVRFFELALLSLVILIVSVFISTHLHLVDVWETTLGIRVYFRKKKPVRMTILERIAKTQDAFREIEVRPAEAAGLRIISVFSKEQPGLLGKIRVGSNKSYTFFKFEIELLYSENSDGVRIFETSHAEGITSISYVLQMLYPNLEKLQFRSIFKEKLLDPSYTNLMEPMGYDEMEEINESKPSRYIDKNIIFYLENFP